MVHLSLAESIISYGKVVWGKTYNMHLTNFEVSQHRLVKHIN